jgi:hypothetical protein
LYRQIAILDRKARRSRLNERVLRDQRSSPLNKYVKQRHGTFTRRDGFGVPKKDLAFQIETKRTESVNGRDRPATPISRDLTAAATAPPTRVMSFRRLIGAPLNDARLSDRLARGTRDCCISMASFESGQPLTKIATGADPKPLPVYPQKQTNTVGLLTLTICAISGHLSTMTAPRSSLQLPAGV